MTGAVPTWQWQVLDAGGVATDIAGATAAAYRPTAQQAGLRLRVVLTLTAPGYDVLVVGTDTAGVLPGILPALSVTVSGYATAQALLTAAPVLGTGPGADDATYAYQWYAAGQALVGRSGPTLDLTDDLVGRSVTVRVTADSPGYTPAAADSVPLRVADAPTLVLTLDGAVRVGETVHADLAGARPGEVVSYSWQRDADVLAGETGATYPIVPADLGSRLRLEATVRVPGATGRSRVSVVTAAVGLGVLAAPVVGLSGRARENSLVTAGVAGDPSWPDDASVGYAWSSARPRTTPQVRLVTADIGTRPSVSVTVTATGYAPRTTRRRTARVQPQQYFTSNAAGGKVRRGRVVTLYGRGPDRARTYEVVVANPGHARSYSGRLAGDGFFRQRVRIPGRATCGTTPVTLVQRDRHGHLVLRGRIDLVVQGCGS